MIEYITFKSEWNVKGLLKDKLRNKKQRHKNFRFFYDNTEFIKMQLSTVYSVQKISIKISTKEVLGARLDKLNRLISNACTHKYC